MQTEEITELLEKELKALQEASELCKDNSALVQNLPDLATVLAEIADILDITTHPYFVRKGGGALWQFWRSWSRKRSHGIFI